MAFRRQILAPFTGGLNKDSPPWMIKDTESRNSFDLIALNGVAMQRRGWEFDGTVADVASDLQSVYRTKFVIADVTRTLTTAANGNIYSHNPAGAGTLIFDGAVTYLPRAVYRDEVIFCAQDGITPLLRFSGATDDGTASDLVSSALIEGQAVIPGLTFSDQPDIGAYANAVSASSVWNTSARILETTANSLTLEDIRHDDEGNAVTITVTTTGFAFPCVSIYSAGSGTNAANVFTGVGTKFTTVGILEGQDALLKASEEPPIYVMSVITDVNSDTSLDTLFGSLPTQTPYDIVRACPFTEAASHNQSLWGTGNAVYPNRVYVGPPGWNPSLPPGAQPPFELFNTYSFESRNDWLLDFVDIPTPYDGDVNVALLSTSNPLLVLKRHDCYGIYGTFPTFTTQMIQEGAGCLDIRSAQNLAMGPVWCGENGVYTYQNGRVIDLTSGRINREYRQFVESYNPSTDFLTTGQIRDHLFVTLRRAGGFNFTWVFDIKNGVWISNFTNHYANFYFSADVPGESSELYWVDDDSHQGRVMKSDTVFGTVNGSNERDGDGTKPRLIANTTYNLSGKSPEMETTLLDMSIVGRVYDGGSVGSTRLDVIANSFDALRDTDTGGSGAIAGSFNSSSATEAVNFGVPRRMYSRNVNLRGRTHTLSFDVATFDVSDHANGAVVEISSIMLGFEDTAERS